MAFKRSSVRTRYPPLRNPLQNKGLWRFLGMPHMPLQSAASTYLVTFEMRNSAERCQSEHFKHSSDMCRLQDSANDPTKKSERHVGMAGTIATRRP